MLDDAGRLQDRLSKIRRQIADEFRCIVVVASEDCGGILRVILDCVRKRPGEFRAAYFILDDDGGGTETDFTAAASADVIEHAGKIRVADRFESDGVTDAETFEKRRKINAGRC